MYVRNNNSYYLYPIYYVSGTAPLTHLIQKHLLSMYYYHLHFIGEGTGTEHHLLKVKILVSKGTGGSNTGNLLSTCDFNLHARYPEVLESNQKFCSSN